jgi:CDP-glycerol glycerophosphotransferase (TagB/SpsB family)
MDRAAYIRQSGIFDAEWYRSAFADAASSPLPPIEHYLQHGLAMGRAPNRFLHEMRYPGVGDPRGRGQDTPSLLRNEESSLDCDIALLGSSGSFNVAYYLQNNPDVAGTGMDPLRHFCQYGWKELRNPNPDFDVWWYWAAYMDPAEDGMNPLVHHTLFGTSSGSEGRPARIHPQEGMAYPPGQAIRRICLYAGYDPDGIVDDYVVTYLRELGRHADVYYLADCDMPAQELEKLATCTKGAWAIRHGAYDFGSYSMLARDLVGWDVIGRYDELILANDSCYLLRSLDDVFATMDARRCDWWGMQATKGIAATRHNPANHFKTAIRIDAGKQQYLSAFEADYTYDFHVGSYFLVFRRPVTMDGVFQRLLSAVTPQATKKNVILKYEIGLTRILTGKNFAFDTFIPDLHPFHPIYSDTHFTLVDQGFPLFKRYLLTENHYRVPGLHAWKERLRELVPGADVEEMERNLLRVADNEQLYRNLRVTLTAAGVPAYPPMLGVDGFVEADQSTPKFDHWWAFPVCAYDGTLAGNERAVFEEVRDDPSLKKIVLTRKRHVDAQGENVVVVPLNSPEGQYYLLRSRQIFVKHSPSINAKFPLSPELHNFINLWHGIPLKRFGYASMDMVDKLDWVFEENRKCRAVISSSKMDTLAMAAAFYPLSYRQVWATGLPRNDFILRAEDALPTDLRAEGDRLRAALAGRRLVLFAPTFKNSQEQGYYRFEAEEIGFLRDWLRRHNAVLGVREHMADKARTYSRMLSSLDILDLSSARYPNIEMLYREAALLVTDYSSCAIDFMLTGRPVISFAYDHDQYANSERGLFYDLDHVFPGPVCRDFAELAAALERTFGDETHDQDDFLLRRRVFFDHIDDLNAWRVVSNVKALYVDSGINAALDSASLVAEASLCEMPHG